MDKKRLVELMTKIKTDALSEASSFNFYELFEVITHLANHHLSRKKTIPILPKPEFKPVINPAIPPTAPESSQEVK
jgi:hypothetical protein